MPALYPETSTKQDKTTSLRFRPMRRFIFQTLDGFEFALTYRTEKQSLDGEVVRVVA